jgi:hypothetical protein
VGDTGRRRPLSPIVLSESRPIAGRLSAARTPRCEPAMTAEQPGLSPGGATVNSPGLPPWAGVPRADTDAPGATCHDDGRPCGRDAGFDVTRVTRRLTPSLATTSGVTPGAPPGRSDVTRAAGPPDGTAPVRPGAVSLVCRWWSLSIGDRPGPQPLPLMGTQGRGRHARRSTPTSATRRYQTGLTAQPEERTGGPWTGGGDPKKPCQVSRPRGTVRR